MQKIIVLIIVFAAAYFLVRRLRGNFSQKGGGCGTGCGCRKEEDPNYH